jgi:hypothetical protein
MFLKQSQLSYPERLQDPLKRNRAGDVVFQLKSVFKDGTTHRVIAPLLEIQMPLRFVLRSVPSLYNAPTP